MTESTIDRMVREAKSRLAVSIEANANYELIQMKKSWATADELTLKWRYQYWVRNRIAAIERISAKSIRVDSIKLGHSFDDLNRGFKRAENAFTDYANALKTLSQKQREVRELNVEIGMHKSALNSTFGKLGARHPIACTADAIAEGLPPL